MAAGPLVQVRAVAKREQFETLLQALRGAWLRACQAAALQHQAALAGWTTVLADGARVPRRALFRPPRHASGVSPATLEIDLADLFRHRRMRPASLSLSFDCELRQRRDSSWHLFIIHPERKSWWITRPRHHVEIMIDGKDDGGGEVRFDGHLWRQFGNRTNGQQS
jgi:hypothetical protein